ncbi:MAG TPA: 4'-phosphopantetheinyl transferase superfamily protein [Aliidongia sp.]|nr:4'-phosphopantetheinyl transferase superfamily protein [Aliidongia sp.]
MEMRADGDPTTLSEAEAAHIVRARPGRAREFAAGRQCARQALERLGRSGWDLLVRADRTPLWPLGIVGSISHTTGCCGVAIGEQRHFRSIGLDIELDGRLTPDLHEQILTPSERSVLEKLPAGLVDKRATLVFSAKEAFYKCQHPLTAEWMDFTDITVDLPDDLPEAGRLVVRPTRYLQIERQVPPPWSGHFVCFEGFVATGFAFREADGL